MSVSITLVGAVTGPEVTFADRTPVLPIGARKTVQLLTYETPDFSLQLSGQPTVLTSAH